MPLPSRAHDYAWHLRIWFSDLERRYRACGFASIVSL